MFLFLVVCAIVLCHYGESTIPIHPFTSYATAPSVLSGSVDSVDLIYQQLRVKYKSRLVCIKLPNCNVFLCGTLHVAKASSEMVQDVIKSLRPKFVVLELCESRIDSLYELETNEQLMVNITLLSVLKMSWEGRSAKTLGTGLLCWLQVKAAHAMGSKLGGELAIAAKEAAALRSTIVLGDRLYGVTIQRVFDKLSVLEKLKMCLLLFWEVVTLSVLRLREYVEKTDDDGFINKEIEKFAQTLPTFSRIILGERDEYMTQTLLEIARIGFPAHHSQGIPQLHRGCVVAVCGAAHINGIERLLASGGSSEEHMRNISSSSRHNSTWPGTGMLQVVNAEALWNQ